MDQQLLHLVFGGKLKATGGMEFVDPAALDIVGIFPNYKQAEAAWKAASLANVDDAHMRYFVVHLHDLIDPKVKTDHQGRVVSSS